MLTSEARIRWQCRRGMLELDLLLLGFFDRHYLQLDSAAQSLFEQFLTNNDQDLYSWLVKKETPDDLIFVELINKICNENIPCL